MIDPKVAFGGLVVALMLTTWALFRLVGWLRKTEKRYFYFDLSTGMLVLGFGLLCLCVVPRSWFFTWMGIVCVVSGGTGLGALLNQRIGLPGPTGARYSSWRKNRLLRCSFCNKSQRDVQKLIAGPGVNICDECVDICPRILEEEGGRKPDPEVPRPDPVTS